MLLNEPTLVDVQKTKIEKVLAETDKRPKKIPCLIFEKETDIHNYLGYRHITGIKEWKLLEKSRYLSDLWKNSFGKYTIQEAAREIAKVIGSRKDYVQRILAGYELYKIIEDEKFYRINGGNLDDTNFHFNYIADSLNKSNIAKFLGVETNAENPIENINEENLSKWTHWLFEKNEQNKTRLIGDSYDLTSLNAILGNEEATKAFENGATLDEAKELTEVYDDQFTDFIKKSLRNIESADRIVTRVKGNPIEVIEDLKNIRLIAQKIIRAIEEKNDE
ncbi:MAG: hypothetical protein QM610_04050 [Chitinophagaceae bacterium]